MLYRIKILVFFRTSEKKYSIDYERSYWLISLDTHKLMKNRNVLIKRWKLLCDIWSPFFRILIEYFFYLLFRLSSTILSMSLSIYHLMKSFTNSKLENLFQFLLASTLLKSTSQDSSSIDVWSINRKQSPRSHSSTRKQKCTMTLDINLLCSMLKIAFIFDYIMNIFYLITSIKKCLINVVIRSWSNVVWIN